MASSSDGANCLVGAAIQAHQLSKRRVTSTTAQTPTTPSTPIVPTTPVIAAHVFSEGNIMEDLQLAAELGKTLLERNKELESTIKELRSIIEDKTQETEYLSKQTAALREVNDSRLRIYEQLEISIQELEKNNQRLSAETNADKRKIKNLSGTVEQLEAKCEDLERTLEDAKSLQYLQDEGRGRPLARRSILAEENSLRRSISCENSAQSYEDLLCDYSELKGKVSSLEEKLKLANKQGLAEAKKREEIEIEFACLSQENGVLRDHLTVMRDKNNFRSIEDELTSLDDTTSSKFCRKCMCGGDDTESNMTVQDIADDFEDLDASYDSIQGECALVKLKNGGYAWGSQESLASMGQVVNCVPSSGSSPHNEGSEVPHNSLLSELDTEYRILIEKYEALVEARDSHDNMEPREATMVDSGVDEVSGPMSIVMTDMGVETAARVGGALRCGTCACDMKPHSVPATKRGFQEELSEVETSSSGFSEGEVCTRATQTETFDDAITPIATDSGFRFLNLRTPLNPCDSRFRNKPEYRKLFHEIFEVLKKEIDQHEVKLIVRRTPIQYEPDEIQESDLLDTTFNISDLSFFADNDENECPNVIKKEDDGSNVENTLEENILKVEENVLKVEELSLEVEKTNIDLDNKPVRPDSLDIDTASTCSSRSRRKKRRSRQKEQDPSQQQQQEKQKSSQKDQQHKENQNLTAPVEAATQRGPSCSRTADLTVGPSTGPNSALRPASAPPSAVSQSATIDSESTPEANTKQNPSRARCKHKKKHSKQKNVQPLQNKHLSKALGQHSLPQGPTRSQGQGPTRSQGQGPTRSQGQGLTRSQGHSSPPPMKSAIPASVQVANLIKFEISYAQALKTSKSRKDQKH